MSRSTFISASCSSAAWLRSIACSMARRSTSSLNGLVRNFDGACLHRLNGHGHVAVTGDEDNRHVDALGRDALL